MSHCVSINSSQKKQCPMPGEGGAAKWFPGEQYSGPWADERFPERTGTMGSVLAQTIPGRNSPWGAHISINEPEDKQLLVLWYRFMFRFLFHVSAY